MENRPSLTSLFRRRRRIVALALLPLLAAAVVAWLESGHWLVVYNDTARPLAALHLHAGSASWTLHDLEPRASRRVRLPRTGAGVVSVTVPEWAPDPAYQFFCDGRDTGTLTVRLHPSRTVTSSATGAPVGRLLRW